MGDWDDLEEIEAQTRRATGHTSGHGGKIGSSSYANRKAKGLARALLKPNLRNTAKKEPTRDRS